MTKRLDLLGWVLLAAAAAGAANGLWMLLHPEAWYHELPVDIPATGPLNAHFVRDVGAAFLTASAALAGAALRPRLRPALVGVAALFYALHAAIHLAGFASGESDAHHFWLDVPGVYAPALLLVAAAAALARRARREPA
jgi:hypothetical protein